MWDVQDGAIREWSAEGAGVLLMFAKIYKRAGMCRIVLEHRAASSAFVPAVCMRRWYAERVPCGAARAPVLIHMSRFASTTFWLIAPAAYCSEHIADNNIARVNIKFFHSRRGASCTLRRMGVWTFWKTWKTVSTDCLLRPQTVLSPIVCHLRSCESSGINHSGIVTVFESQQQTIESHVVHCGEYLPFYSCLNFMFEIWESLKWCITLVGKLMIRLAIWGSNFNTKDWPFDWRARSQYRGRTRKRMH